MPFRLQSLDGDHVFELRSGAVAVVGRSLASDLPLLDPTISRRHAELAADDAGVDVRDLGSSNGTLVNGARIGRSRIVAGDMVTFGRVAFELRNSSLEANGSSDTPPTQEGGTSARNSEPVVPTIVHQRLVPSQRQLFAEALRKSGTFAAIEDLETAAAAERDTGPQEAAPEAPRIARQDRDRLRLELLLELSKALSSAIDVDALLVRVGEFVFRIIDVDRLSVLLVDEEGDLEARLGRDRTGARISRAVPLSIAQRVVTDKVAILSANAPEDKRFTGESIVRQQVHSAICVPLVGNDGRVLGVLYVDSLSARHLCTEEDLEFLVGFSGIVAVAIENSMLAERVRREAVVRNNFERFFPPGLAERIASERGPIALGGERREIAVLFCDIRDFTPLAASMNPDDTAHLLNTFFTEMVECVFRNGGTLDKFMGDAVMAQWGAPISSDVDADRALEAAMDMRASLERLNARWRAEGRPELSIGIGLNYGEAFAGTIGSERRLEYTVIGDTVNTASRLCAWADGGEIVMTDALRAALTREHPLEPRTSLTLRGKREPVAVWRVTS